MRVKRSEAYKTRVETRRQNTRLATAFSNVLNNTSSSLYADTDTLRDVEYEARKKRDEDTFVAGHEEAVLSALRTALNSAPDYKRRENKGPDLSQTISNHNSVALRMEDPGVGVAAVSPNSFVQHAPMTPDVAARIANLEMEVQRLQSDASMERNIRMMLQTQLQALTTRIEALEWQP